MRGEFMDAIVTIAGLIIGVATISVLVSPRAKTSSVIQSAASGFSNSLATAMSPVTGEAVNINTSYPSDGGYGALNFSAPTFN
jgi:hypothetical protein